LHTVVFDTPSSNATAFDVASDLISAMVASVNRSASHVAITMPFNIEQSQPRKRTSENTADTKLSAAQRLRRTSSPHRTAVVIDAHPLRPARLRRSPMFPPCAIVPQSLERIVLIRWGVGVCVRSPREPLVGGVVELE
jgi:hypothetical protein